MFLVLRRAIFAIFLLSTLVSCGQEPIQPESTQPDSSKAHDQSGAVMVQKRINDIAPTPPITDTLQNWKDIKQSGVIRALKLVWEEETSLPRSGSNSFYHIELLNQFASKHGLRVQWVPVKDLNQMFDYLAQHKADIIPRHLTITQSRLSNMDFTQALLHDTEILIAKKGTVKPTQDSSITVSVPEGTAYIDSIANSFPHWTANILQGTLSAEDIADALVEKKFEYSLLDGASVNTLLNYRDDIVALMEFPTSRKLAWAVGQNNQSLLDKLNEFIAVHHVTQTFRSERKLDLKEMNKQNLTLRIITRNSPETYFLWRGELMGFEYELMREFAKRHKVRLEVIVAESYEQMKSLLAQGKGDLIAAGISRIEERKSELKFSFRYNRVSELLVAHKDSPLIKDFKDLKGRTISIRKTSAFWTTAQTFAKQHGVNIIAADEQLPTELLIAQVANKVIDLTIADSNLVSIEKRFRDNIVTPLTLKENVPYAYAVRNNNPQLLNALNAFIKKEYRGTFYNVIKGKYFSSPKRLKRYRQDRITANSSLSPYDHQVQTDARKYQFDWRLITSQMFQESRFNPSALSAAGAQGLMQVLPRTAKELGYLDLTQPEQSISAGIQYMDWTRARFEKNIHIEEKIYFALAAYNAGFGHVRDAQKLAKQMNLRDDKWFDNVEKAMLLLQQPKYYKKTRYGYCRGSEPVNYVREIQQRYLSYVDITD